MEYAFTKDTFKCGMCAVETFSIDEYVTHMLEVEKCIMVLQNSIYLKDLMLPRFKRKILPQKIEGVSSSDNVSIINNSKGLEIEVGKGVFRWKCRICCLTFSREAALLNHFKLTQHEVIEKVHLLKNETPVTSERQIKTEIKENLLEDKEDYSQKMMIDDKGDVKNSPDDQNELPLCKICGQIFKSVNIVIAHMKIVHSEKRPFVCKIDGCSLSFKTKGSLVRHVRRHTGDRPYKCLRCGRAYRESGSLLRHQQSKTPCDQKLDSHLPRYGITQPFVGSLKVDSELKSQTLPETQVDCKVPLKKERLEDDSYKLHEEEFHETEETKAKVKREICTKYLDSSASNLLHLMPDRKPPLNWKETKNEALNCGLGEEKEIKKIEESRLEEEKIIRLCYLCPVCYKSYSKSSAFSAHMNTHISELSNECETCKKQFSSSHALCRHLLSHSSARQFECKECGKTFKLRSHALTHLKSHSNIKSIPCLECGRYFKSVSSRNNHMKIHKGEKDFECAVCFKKFLVKASFLRHLRVHLKGRSEGCDQKPSLHKSNSDELDSKPFVGQSAKNREETLSEINDTLSDIDSELESYLSEKWDLSSIYSEHSELSFSPEDYLIPHVQNIEPVTSVIVKQEVMKENSSK